MDDTPIRVAFLVSGRGRTALNLLDHMRDGRINAVAPLAISSRKDAAAIERLRNAGVSTEVVDRRKTPDPNFHDRIAQLLRDASIDWALMAGFYSFWQIPDDFAGRVVNIHPALLPAFGGKGFYGNRVHRAVLESGATRSGCTVHFADNQYDHGPIILQRTVEVLPDDTPSTLGARVFEQEKIAYIRAIELLIEDRISANL